jgi:hypothetical protein
MQQLMTSGRNFLNNELKSEGITVSEGAMVEKEAETRGGSGRGNTNTLRDKDGTVRYRGSDGNYYRVNVNGPQDKRFVEKWNSRSKTWETYTPKRTPGIPRAFQAH